MTSRCTCASSAMHTINVHIKWRKPIRELPILDLHLPRRLEHHFGFAAAGDTGELDVYRRAFALAGEDVDIAFGLANEELDAHRSARRSAAGPFGVSFFRIG